MAASTTKKKTTASSGKSGSTQRKSSASGAKSSGKGRSSSSRKAPAKKPIRREVGALVCLVLALFAAIGYFVSDEGAFIAFFCNFIKGLCGYGFWIAPLMLLAASFLLFNHRGKPVELRLTGILLLPVLVGAFFHLLLAGNPEGTWMEVLGILWTDGIAQHSGGVLGGLLAMAVNYAFSLVGGGLLLAVLIAAAALIALHITPADILNFFTETRENMVPYDPADYPERPQRERRRPVVYDDEAVEKASRSGKGKGKIDIPVDDGPVIKPIKPTEPVTTVRKKSFFNKNPNVMGPDEMATGKSRQQEPEEPQYEDAPEIEPIPEPPKKRKGKQAPMPVPEELKQEKPKQEEPPEPEDEGPDIIAARPEPKPSSFALFGQKNVDPDAGGRIVAPEFQEEEDEPLPAFGVPVIRQPAVTRESRGDQVSKADAAAAQADIAKEIEAGMGQDVPEYRYPPLELLNEGVAHSGPSPELMATKQRLQGALASFNVDAHITDVISGPAVTRYELELEQGVKLNKIVNLSNDIALSLGAQSVRVAPIPNKISTVGIEVPNAKVTPVAIREVLESDAFQNSKSKVSFAVGKDISGNCIVGDIDRMPHLLIAGTTGSGKSVCTNSLIISLLYKSTPEEVRLIMVDPKMVELAPYNGIPHLLIPVVTDPKKAAGALQWAVNEMMKRYTTFSEIGAKNISSYNNHARKEGKEPMAHIVVVIDELADLMVVAAKEVEESICRVAQMGRAAGMHLVVATQRPSSDVITGLMKANIPSRIAFAVKEAINSRIILDAAGAEKLVGKGDMLYAPLGQDRLRVQGCFISEEEVQAVVDFIKEGSTASYDESVMHEIDKNAEEKDKAAKGPSEAADVSNDYDELLPNAVDVVLEVGQASVSMLQRRLKLGYGRAARLVDQMEEIGIVGPYEGSKPRQLKVTKAQWAEMKYKRGFAEAPGPGFDHEPVPEEYPGEEDAIAQSMDFTGDDEDL